MINEILYCERLFYLEWVQDEFEDNAFTVEGRVVHSRVDKPGLAASRGRRLRTDVTAEATSANELPADTRPYQARSVWLTSPTLGITAKIDLVDADGTGRVVPVDYKRGAAPDLPEGAYLPERAQVCAQVLLLREHGFQCDEGSIYFAKSRKRVPVQIDDGLIATTLAAVRRARELAVAGRLPPPLQHSPKCQGCSLVGICLPDEVQLLREHPQRLDRSDVTEPLLPAAAKARPLAVARDERQPLYLSDQGAWVGVDKECLVVKTKEGTKTEVRLPNTSHVAVYGNVQISTQALRALLERNVPVVFFSYGGWYYGRTITHDSKNVELRASQHGAAVDPAFRLEMARGLVEAKVLNCRTMLRRNHASPDETVLFELKQLARKAVDCDSLESLLGIEGTAARTYFGAFSGMLSAQPRRSFDLAGRNRRPPRDPVNALLSFCYGLLTKDVALATTLAGLDPLVGFYHRPRFGRPALALDLMEELRPLVADSVVIGVLNGRVVADDDFIEAGGACALTPAARRRVILAYERRMQQEVIHPVFGYRVSYRRLLELQARLLGRVLLGELEAYPSFRTR